MTEQERTEICLECRACCEYIGVLSQGSIAGFMETWGYQLRPLGGDNFAAVLHHPCQHLTDAGCSIYETRPKFCKEYFACNDPAFEHLCKLKKEDI